MTYGPSEKEWRWFVFFVVIALLLIGFAVGALTMWVILT